MAVLGKVAGTMLKDNLVRNSVDLSIDTDLMYFDVVNRRVGINTTMPGNAFVANGNATISNLYINGNVITSLTGNLVLNSISGIDASYLTIGNVAEPLYTTDAATKYYVDSAISLLTGSEFTSISGINANIAAANIAIEALNANVTAANSAIETLQTQVYNDSNVAAYLPFYDGKISAANANIGNFFISNNTITVTNTDGNIILTPLGNGIISFNTTTAVVMPVGNNSNRPLDTQIGMTRFNTISQNLEVWDGVSWIETGGGGSTSIISDKFIGDGIETNFILSQYSTTAGTMVSINGVVQIPDVGYSITGNVLSLSEPPVTTDIVEARSIASKATINSISEGNSYIHFGSAVNSYPITATIGNVDKFFIGLDNVIVYTTLVTNAGISSNNANISLVQDTTTAIDSFDLSKYRTAKYIVSISDFTNNKYQSSELLVNHNGLIANIFASSVSTNNEFVSFSASVTATEVIVQANSSSVNSYCNFQQTYISS
jgi:hypothetical protein